MIVKDVTQTGGIFFIEKKPPRSITVTAQLLYFTFLFQIFSKESGYLFKGNNIHPVIQINMVCARNNEKLFIVARQFFKSAFTEIAGMNLLSVHKQNGRSYLMTVLQYRHIHKRQRRRDIPAAVGV